MSFNFPYRGDRTQALKPACKTDQSDFKDWTSCPMSNLVQEISPNIETLGGNNLNPDGIYLLKVNIRNTRTRCKICSKLTLKTPE